MSNSLESMVVCDASLVVELQVLVRPEESLFATLVPYNELARYECRQLGTDHLEFLFIQ
jgi:hypothetical protein